MYDDDYAFVQEIFSNTLAELSEGIPLLDSAFHSGDISQIRKIIHKIKPSFGFLGLLSIQETLEHFEASCTLYDSTAALESYFFEIRKEIAGGFEIIGNEVQALKEFNTSRL